MSMWSSASGDYGVAPMEADPGAEDPRAADNWVPDTSQGLPFKIGKAFGDALPWLERMKQAEMEAGE